MARASLTWLLRGIRDALLDAEASLRQRCTADGSSDPDRMPRLAELAMSFDCRLRYRRALRSRRYGLVMQFGRPRFAWFDRRPMHHVRIVCLARTGWQPRIEIDGRPIEP